MLANGSLLLQPLSKDHQGGWECLATNRVATVSAGTVVMVLGGWTDLISAKPRVDILSHLICIHSCRRQFEFTESFICSSGTSPHVVSSVSVVTEMNQANVSWVPGFDGGYTQKFTVWSVIYCTKKKSKQFHVLFLYVVFYFSFPGSSRHLEGNTNGRLCLCQHPKPTCW